MNPDLQTWIALAEAAEGSLAGPPQLPSGWKLVATVTDPRTPLQAVLAQGSASTGQTVALALGAPWSAFAAWYQFPYFQPYPPPSSITGGSSAPPSTYAALQSLLAMPRISSSELALSAGDRARVQRILASALPGLRAGGERTASLARRVEHASYAVGAMAELGAVHPAEFAAQLAPAARGWDALLEHLGPKHGVALDSQVPQVDYGTMQSYLYLQAALWTAAKLAPTGQPWVVVGHGPAALTAELAAMDFRPGKPGAAQATPATSISAVTFSAPALGNSQYPGLRASLVPNATSYLATAPNGSVVDQFPSAPTNATGWYAGTPSSALNAVLPAIDDPWIERSLPFYADGGVTEGPNAPQPPTGPSGYDPDLAFTLAQLAGVAYQRAQHPSLGVQLPSPWVFASDLAANGATWGSVFTAPGQLAIAFRGTVSWQDLFAVQGDAFVTSATGINGKLATGLANLWTALQPAVLAALPASGTTLYLTGHDLGGALATVAAEYLLAVPQSGKAAPSALYTFGPPPFADAVFQAMFPASFAAFRLQRPGDQIATIAYATALLVAPKTPIALSGTPSIDDPTAHCVSSYIDLLDPRGATS